MANTDNKTTSQELYNFIFEACNILRGPVSQDNFKDYITPLLYYKRISDVYDEETEEALELSGGDKDFAALPEQHRFDIPDGCHWQDVRERTENVGSALVGAMRQIELANPDTLYGVLSIFSAQKWTDKRVLSDERISNLIEHMSKIKLGNRNYSNDLMGDAYEIMLKKFADDSKAQVVVYNRECCVKYKKAIDALLGREDETVIVMHTDGDKADDYKQYQLSRDEQKRVLDQFRDPLSPLKFVIVTSKLLTGFDAPILQCMYLDKPMKDHTLLQAICRTNRKYTHDKLNGLIVDFVGVFDNVAKSLAFDEETIKTVIKNIDEIRAMIPSFMDECLRFFPGVDRTLGNWEGLQAAQQCLKDESVKTDFAKHFARLSRAWEIVSPDKSLDQYQADYSWMAGVYQSIRPVTSGPSLIWTLLGAKTIEIIHNSIDSINIGTPLEDLVVNADIIDQAITEAEAKKRTIELEQVLRLRLQTHSGDINYKPFVEKLEELRERMEQSLETSIDFLKQLLVLAKDLLKAEKKVMDDPIDRRHQARAALTELFESIRTPETPIIVENVVNDIDKEIVAIVRKFSDAFKSVTAQREIKQKLRTILWIKYGLKDQEVFDKAYSYIEQYY